MAKKFEDPNQLSFDFFNDVIKTNEDIDDLKQDIIAFSLETAEEGDYHDNISNEDKRDSTGTTGSSLGVENIQSDESNAKLFLDSRTNIDSLGNQRTHSNIRPVLDKTENTGSGNYQSENSRYNELENITGLVDDSIEQRNKNETLSSNRIELGSSISVRISEYEGSEPNSTAISGAEQGRTGSRNYKYDSLIKDLIPTSEKDRINANILAIKTINYLESENTSITREQQEILVKYTGWGSLSSCFDPNGKYYDEIKSLLTDIEFDAAKKSSLNAYYTPHEITSIIWKTLEPLNISNARILEPSCATGNFIGTSFEFIKNNNTWEGIELDSISSRIASFLYPENNVNIYNIGFQDYVIKDKFDIAVLNPPFASNVNFLDYDHSYYTRFNLQEYFLGKSIEILREGGLCYAVMPSSFLDKVDNSLRKVLAQKLQLINAVRLPNDIFSGADVQTDIILFKKREQEIPLQEIEKLSNYKNIGVGVDIDTQFIKENIWVNSFYVSMDNVSNNFEYEYLLKNKTISKPSDTHFSVNASFLNINLASDEFIYDLNKNDEPYDDYIVNGNAKIFGYYTETSSRFGITYKVQNKYSSVSIEQFIQTTIDVNSILAINFDNSRNYHLQDSEKPKDSYIFLDNFTFEKILWKQQKGLSLKVGSLFTDNQNNIFRIEDADNSKITINNLSKDNKFSKNEIEKLKLYCTLRDTLKYQIYLETNSKDTNEIEDNRKKLKNIYDNYVTKYQHLHSLGSKILSIDNDFNYVKSLELEYIPPISKAVAKKNGIEPKDAIVKEAIILSERVINQSKEIDMSDYSPQDVLLHSLQEYGKININFIAEFYNKDFNEIYEQYYIGTIFYNVESKEWEHKTQYLSGNIKNKLDAAINSLKYMPILNNNIESLNSVLPPKLNITEIGINFGSTWIPLDIYAQYFNFLFHTEEVDLVFNESLSKYFVNDFNIVDYSEYYRNNGDIYGTSYKKGNEIFVSVLNNEKLLIKESTGNKIEYIGRDGKRKVKDEKAINHEATSELQRKAALIKENFNAWVLDNENITSRIEAIYNEKFNVYVTANYDGSFFNLGSNSNKNISLRPHQKNALWRGLSENRLYLDHTVGAGKTLVCSAIAMESIRLKKAKKIAITVPNHLVEQWKNEILLLYPSANILLTTNKDYEKPNYQQTLSKIALNNYNIVIIPHSCFVRISPDPKTYLSQIEKDLKAIEIALHKIKKDSKKSGNIMRVLEQKRLSLEARANKAIGIYTTSEQRNFLTFADLGFDKLIVDEAHEFKNLGFFTSLQVSGLGNVSGSSKCTIFYSHLTFIKNLPDNNGTGIYCASGTPISNSITELYNLFKYFERDNEFFDLGFGHFDTWARNFGKIESVWEVSTSGQDFVLKDRFAKFINVPELISLYRGFADVVIGKDLYETKEFINNMPIMEGGKPQTIINERTDAQSKYIGEPELVVDENGNPILMSNNPVREYPPDSIIGRINSLPGKDPSIDNILVITSDAKKCSLDPRIIVPNATDEPNLKVRICANNIAKLYKETDDYKGFQLVFCDLSVPKGRSKIAIPKNEDSQLEEVSGDNYLDLNELLSSNDNSNFSVYEELKRILTEEYNIPPDEVQFIHDYNTQLQKNKLFSKCRTGDVRVLLGSTSKLGTGTNIQQRMVALHNLDAPWRPSDMEQREGRIYRQGNLNKKIIIFRYATEGTYDARSWQILENKAVSIEQFRKGQFKSRDIEDITAEAANAAELKAAASGNPLILWSNELNNKIKSLDFEKKSVFNRNRRIKDEIKNFKNKIINLTKLIKDINIDISNPEFNNKKFILNNKEVELTEELSKDIVITISKDLKDTIEQLKTDIKDENIKYKSIEIGSFRGLNIVLEVFKDDKFRSSLFNNHNYSIAFSLKSTLSSANYSDDKLIYASDVGFNLRVLLIRLMNITNSLPTKLDLSSENLETTKQKLDANEKSQIEIFKDENILKELKEEQRIIEYELNRMQNEPEYKSEYKPQKFLEIKSNNDGSGEKKQVDKHINIDLKKVDFSSFGLRLTN